MRLPKYTCGLDPGNSVCGVCLLHTDGRILKGFEEKPASVYDRIIEEIGPKNSFDIAIEGINPYSLTGNDAIETAYIIGELRHRFKSNPMARKVQIIPRSTVRKWIFDTATADTLDRVRQRMEYLDRMRLKKGLTGLRRKDGAMREPSFVFVDDRTVIAALKGLMSIPTPKPGKSNIYGLRDHSWQALATAKVFMELSG